MSDVDEGRRQAREEYDVDPIEVNRQIVEEYRATGGRIERLGGTTRMLLLTTTGARTGAPRTAPMMFVRDGDRLVAHAGVTVEVGADRFDAVARVTSGEERDRLWRLFPFPEHQDRTSRPIPVVALERSSG
ncbi:MAG: nitroreductase family deazaflavin-dependent oxidoreductase [Candidatus Dormibacteraeota bacterium]|nr:nitroreductase family deazaflavin-dependent oxidoreductase [Candidatus Dormibacteraeota bacterium]MBO0762762.1 nitroreductase family deazaflavin-dependent oxidoreductase [Candidatus Dormibacteraeota bacterium]